MDWTPAQHALIALACAGIGWICGSVEAGAAFGAALFIGREHTQAEYRWIERYGNGKRDNMPIWGGVDPRVWDMGSLLDVAAPVLAGAVLLGGLYLW